MIKAIETSYKGYRFRSRLEARWGVFFDALDIKWEYESEGFDLHEQGHQTIEVFRSSARKEYAELSDAEMHVRSFWSGEEINLLDELLQNKKAYYLPDFHIPSLGFVEIKPYQGYASWGNNFVLPKLQGAILLHGTPGTQSDECYEVCTFYDVPYFLGYCPICKSFGYGFMGWAERICKDYKACGHYQKDDLSESRPMLNAITAARSARFEHGEQPNVY